MVVLGYRIGEWNDLRNGMEAHFEHGDTIESEGDSRTGREPGLECIDEMLRHGQRFLASIHSNSILLFESDFENVGIL